jgi:hypothetical protein
MRKKKAILLVILLFMFGCFLPSQSLVDVAKKEKERRAKWKVKNRTSALLQVQLISPCENSICLGTTGKTISI